MATLALEAELEPTATAVRVSEAELTVEFEDGRTLSVPVAWYPRLLAKGQKVTLQDFISLKRNSKRETKRAAAKKR